MGRIRWARSSPKYYDTDSRDFKKGNYRDGRGGNRYLQHHILNAEVRNKAFVRGTHEGFPDNIPQIGKGSIHRWEPCLRMLKPRGG